MRKQLIYQKNACTFQTMRSNNIDINRNYTNTSQSLRSSENIVNMRNINNSNISQSQRSSSGNHNSNATSRNNNDDTTNTSQTLRSSENIKKY